MKVYYADIPSEEDGHGYVNSGIICPECFESVSATRNLGEFSSLEFRPNDACCLCGKEVADLEEENGENREEADAEE